MRLAIALLALCNCRFGFDDGPVLVVQDAMPASDAPFDVLPDARTITTLTFGERTSSGTAGVTSDTTLAEDLPTTVGDGNDDLSMSAGPGFRNHALLRFDLSSVAPGTLVAAARVQLTRIDYGDESVGDCDVHTVTEAWNQATATWTLRQTGVAWTTAGGTFGAKIATAPRPIPDTIVIDLDIFAVQAWIDNPATNHGMAFIPRTPTTGGHFHMTSSDKATADERPQLALDLGL